MVNFRLCVFYTIFLIREREGEGSWVDDITSPSLRHQMMVAPLAHPAHRKKSAGEKTELRAAQMSRFNMSGEHKPS